MMYTRDIEKQIHEYLKGKSNKILFIWGPRRSGKTTLLEKYAQELHTRIFDFDLLSDRELFVPTIDALSKLAHVHPVILIDEVQTYPEATVVLKLLHGKFPVKIIATGSSELRQKTGKDFDTLAGRFEELYCLPLSVHEIVHNAHVPSYEITHLTDTIQNTAQIFGSYPELYADDHYSEEKKISILERIVNTYVLKDVVSIYNLKDEKLARDILTKIALQIGSEVSVREIAESLGAHKDTVANYIEIFIKNYILIPLPSFRTNLRKSVSENRKLFFYDIGIRNAFVKDFRDIELRPDKGGVFENFVISEIEKIRRTMEGKFSLYFYREYGGQEVDLILETYKKVYSAFEIKSTKGHMKQIFPLPHAQHIITPKNYYERLSKLR